MIILIVFTVTLLLLFLSARLKSRALGAFSLLLCAAAAAVLFIAKEEEFLLFAENCAAPIFAVLIVLSLISCLLLTFLEKDRSLGLSLLPSLIAGSVLCDISIVYMLNFILSMDLTLLKVLSIFIIPIFLILCALIIAVVYGAAIGFPFAVNFITKNLKSHSALTAISSAVCSVFFALAIAHSGQLYLLTESFSNMLTL